jgi:hypothetical protein
MPTKMSRRDRLAVDSIVPVEDWFTRTDGYGLGVPVLRIPRQPGGWQLRSVGLGTGGETEPTVVLAVLLGPSNRAISLVFALPADRAVVEAIAKAGRVGITSLDRGGLAADVAFIDVPVEDLRRWLATNGVEV